MYKTMSEKIIFNGMEAASNNGSKSSVWKTLFKWWAYLASYWNNSIGASYLPAIDNTWLKQDQSASVHRHPRLRGQGELQLLPFQYRMLSTNRVMSSVTMLSRQVNDFPNVSDFFTALANDGKLSVFNCKVYDGLISMDEIGCKAARAMASLLAISQEFQTVVVAEGCEFTLDEEKQSNGLYSIRYHLKCSNGDEKSFGVYDVAPDVLEQLRLAIHTPELPSTTETMSGANTVETLPMDKTESITSSTEVSTANIGSTTAIEKDNTTPEITTIPNDVMTSAIDDTLLTEDTTMEVTHDDVTADHTITDGSLTTDIETVVSEDVSHESIMESQPTTVVDVSENTADETVNVVATTTEEQGTSVNTTDDAIIKTHETISATPTVTTTDETLTSRTDTELETIVILTTTEDNTQSATDEVTAATAIDEISSIDNEVITTLVGEDSTIQTQETMSTILTVATTESDITTKNTQPATDEDVTKAVSDKTSIPENTEMTVSSDSEYTMEDESTNTKGLPKAAGYSMSTVAGLVLGAGMACVVEQCCYGKIKMVAKVAPIKQNSATDEDPAEAKSDTMAEAKSNIPTNRVTPDTMAESKPDITAKVSDVPSTKTIALRKSIITSSSLAEPKLEKARSMVAPLSSVRLPPLDNQFVQQIEDKLLLG